MLSMSRFGIGPMRRVGNRGHICHKGKVHFVGKGLRKEFVEVAEEGSCLGLYYAGVRFGQISLSNV